MVDIVDKETRSRMMSGIRGKDTKPELMLRHALHAAGLRYRLHQKNLPGKPDLVFPKYRAVVFVHGCCWHRHVGCRFATSPATRSEFWAEKFATNVQRDQRNRNELVKAGWKVGIVWECSLKKAKMADAPDRIADWLRSTDQYLEI